MVRGAAVGVQEEEQKRKNTALMKAGADGRGVRDFLPQTHMSVRKSVIHLQMVTGMFIWESLPWRRYGRMVLKAELKSTSRILA